MTSASLQDGIAREERAGLRCMLQARLGALGLLGAWLTLTVPFERAWLYLLAILVFALLGAAPWIAARREGARPGITAAFLLLDAALLVWILIAPPPFGIEAWTPQLNLRLPGFLYLGVFLAGMALSYSPALVVWTGAAALLAWSGGFLWVAARPESIPHTSQDMLDGGLSAPSAVAAYLDPDAVSLTRLYNQMAFLILLTAILALAVWRGRRLLRRQVAAETQRSALSRYFSPNMVEALASRGGTLSPPAVQPAAVLFVDMVGFTAISERLPPVELARLLSGFHGRMARVAFAHDGAVDKYIGDAVMVVFGTPRPRPDDPARALACAVEMIAEAAAWSRARAEAGEPAAEVGVGLHFGEVIAGDIGDARRLEYTVLGDAVNLASRLERLTRETGSPLVVSEALVQAARAAGADIAALAPGLRPDRSRSVRGRRAPVSVWTLPPREAAAPGIAPEPEPEPEPAAGAGRAPGSGRAGGA